MTTPTPEPTCRGCGAPEVHPDDPDWGLCGDCLSYRQIECLATVRVIPLQNGAMPFDIGSPLYAHPPAQATTDAEVVREAAAKVAENAVAVTLGQSAIRDAIAAAIRALPLPKAKASVGAALMEAIQNYSSHPFMVSWHYVDCPSEIVGDLLYTLDKTAAKAKAAGEEG